MRVSHSKGADLVRQLHQENWPNILENDVEKGRRNRN